MKQVFLGHIQIFQILFLFFFPLNFGWAGTYLVTCATSGIGESVAEILAQDKHSLILAGRNQESLSSISKRLTEKYSTSVFTLELNFDSIKNVETAGSHLLKSLDGKKINGIVLIGPRPSFSTKGIPETSEWQQNLQLAFLGPLELIRLIAGSLNKPSSLVVISGVTSKYFIPNYTNTNVIRVMWSGEVKNLSVQLASSHTRVNAISPGLILTQFNQNLVEARAQDGHLSVGQQIEKETANIPAHRHGRPEDVAKTVKFLLSEESSFMNGQNISLDGGASPTY